MKGIAKKQSITVIVAIAFVVIAAVILYLYSPLDSILFPRCIVKSLTGYECPGCGAQRAIHELLHLHVGAAFRFNPLLVISIPYLILGFALDNIIKHPSEKIRRLRNILYGRHAIVVILCIILIFTVVRNII